MIELKLHNCGQFQFDEGLDFVVMTEPGEDNCTPRLLPKQQRYLYYMMAIKPACDEEPNEQNPLGRMLCPIEREVLDKFGWYYRRDDGSIVTNAAGDILLDVGAPGFREMYAEALIRRIEEKFLDGVVFDCAYPYAISLYDCATSKYPDDKTWELNAWRPFYRYVISRLTAKCARLKVIVNGAGEYRQRETAMWRELRAHAHGVVYEQWAYSLDGRFVGQHRLSERILALQNDPKLVWVCDVGAKFVDDAQRAQRVSLGAYLIGMPTSSQLVNKRAFCADWGVGEVKALADKLGYPANYPQHYSDVMFRSFDNGIVAINASNLNPVALRTHCGKIVIPPEDAIIATWEILS